MFLCLSLCMPYALIVSHNRRTKEHFVFVICVNVKGKEVTVIPALIIFLFSYDRILIYNIHSMIIMWSMEARDVETVLKMRLFRANQMVQRMKVNIVGHVVL